MNRINSDHLQFIATIAALLAAAWTTYGAIWGKKIDAQASKETTLIEADANKAHDVTQSMQSLMDRMERQAEKGIEREARLAIAVETVTEKFYKSQQELQQERLDRVTERAEHKAEIAEYQAERLVLEQKVDELSQQIDGLVSVIKLNPPTAAAVVAYLEDYRPQGRIPYDKSS